MELINQIYQNITKIYWPVYYRWLAEKLSETSPFVVLMVAISLLFIMVVYVWFRNRDGNI